MERIYSGFVKHILFTTDEGAPYKHLVKESDKATEQAFEEMKRTGFYNTSHGDTYQRNRIFAVMLLEELAYRNIFSEGLEQAPKNEDEHQK